MKESKPFPHIPIIPGEEERTPEEQGAPKSAEESLLALHAEELNLVGTDIGRSRGKPQAERRAIQRERFKTFLANPDALERYFDTLHIIEARDNPEGQNGETDLRKYERTFLLDLNRYIEIPKEFDPAALREWFALSLTSDLYRPIAEKVLGAWCSVRTPEATLNFLYAFTHGIIESGDQRVFIEGLKALCGENKLFNHPRVFINFVASAFENDDLLSKQEQIDSVITHFEPLVPEALKAWQQKLAQALHSEELAKFVRAKRAHEPSRVEAVTAFITAPDKTPPGKEREWPYKLLYEPGPLRLALYKRVEIEEGDVSFVLPHSGAVIQKPDIRLLRPMVVADLELGRNLPPEQRTFSDQNVVSSIFYLMPDTAVTHRRDILRENVRLREKTLREQKHSLSPRGDKIIIVDTELKDLGFESVVFKPAEEKLRMTVEVNVRNHRFILEINRDLNIESAGTHDQFQVALDRRMFFEHILLSHLRELFCGERILPGQRDAPSDAEALEREKEFKGRRGHRRDLPAGQKPNMEQILLAMKEQGWDMVRINEENILRGARIQTYVRISEVATGVDPVISRAPHAMDGFQRIVAAQEPPPPPGNENPAP